MVYREGLSAYDVIMMAKTMSESNNWTDVTVHEFDREETLSLGGDIPRYVQLEGASLKAFDASKLDLKAHQLATLVEKTIGVPALPSATINSSIALKPIETIVERLQKLKKKAKRHVKSLKKLAAGVDDCQDPEILGGIAILETVLNGGNVLDIKAIVSHIHGLYVRRERDKAYYMFKYPMIGKMHACQNGEILAAIREGIECLTVNPFQDVRCYGASNYAN